MDVDFYQMFFSICIEMIMWFLSFLLLLWYITLIHLCMLNHPGDPGINSTGCTVWSLLCIIGFSLYFVENFCIYIYQIYWLLIFFFDSVFALFCYHGDGGFIECLWESSFLFNLLEAFKKDQYKFFLLCLVQFACEAM